MQYMGGKHKISKRLVEAMGEITGDYYEPFVGGANVITKIVAKNRFASDANPALISMWKAVQNGWVPPEIVTEEEYKQARHLPDTDPRKTFIGFGCSFAGKYFGGYARNAKNFNYAAAVKRGVLRKAQYLHGVIFETKDYRDTNCKEGDTYYADPPYANTTQYKGAPDKFCSKTFWEHMTYLSNKGVRVFVSEYAAPDDWVSVLDCSTTLGLRTKTGGNEKRVDRLFVHRNGVVPIVSNSI